MHHILVGMRTTLDIDPRVLAVARAKVYEGRNRTIGEAISELALAGLQSQKPPIETPGPVLLPTVEGHIITNEMAAEALLDE